VIDTHVHLNDVRFDGSGEGIIAAFARDGLRAAVNIGTDRPSSEKAVAMARRHERLYCAVGVHPHDSRDFNEEDGEYFLRVSAEKKVVAIGEIGLDYHYDLSPRPVQREVFVRQMELARRAALPVIIHLRDAAEDMLDILCANRELYARGLVIHCFSEDREYAGKLLDLGAYISFSGSVTFKGSVKVREAARYVPADRFLIETDCPYLTPEPHRGKPNVPAYVRHVAEKLAEVRGTDFGAIERQSTENALRCFEKLRECGE
jgi:TatD DNase family protein